MWTLLKNVNVGRSHSFVINVKVNESS